MTTCPKCNKELSDDAKFCEGCGTKIFETIYCPNCGSQTSTEFAFCQSCGASVTESPAVQPAAAPAAEIPAAEIPVQESTAEAPKEKKKFPQNTIKFAGIGAAIVAVLILVISLLLGGGNDNIYALYLKDSEIFFSDLKKNSESWQLTSKLIDGSDIDAEELAEDGAYLGYYTHMSEDGKYIFFPDKIGEDEGFNLYYKEVGKPDKDAVKVDSEVMSYTVDKSAAFVTYIKGEERNLYQYNIRKDSKDKIAGEVKYFEVSEDGKEVLYINSENGVYLKSGDEEKEKIASDISSFEHATEDFSTIYYVKEDSLYKQEKGKEKEKIASDVSEVIKIYSPKEIYYIKTATEENSLKNYVVDDMKDSDATLTAPSYPDYPTSPSRPYWFDYDTDAEYEVAYEAYTKAYEAWQAECDRMEEEYDAARDAYSEKRSRDSMREELEEKTLSQSISSLCFYNGKEEIVITDALASSGYYNYAANAPVITYKAYNQSKFEKVKLSEVDSLSDLENMVEAALFSSSEKYIAVKETATIVEQEKEATSIAINPDGTTVYYVDNIEDGKNYGDLYCISISKGVLGKAEVYDSEVYSSSYGFISDTEFKYFKDYKDGVGTLYINKNKVDDDVAASTLKGYAGVDKVFYLTSIDKEKETGTLKFYDGKKSEKIADDVFYQYSIVPDGRVLYLVDYSTKYHKGELYEWAKGKTRKIDDDVIAVLSIPSTDKEGFSYGW